MEVSDQEITEAISPPIVTVLEPWEAPKLVPVTVMFIPPGPEAGLSEEIYGVTVKLTPLLWIPETVTTTVLMPADTPDGTSTEMAVLPQLKTEAESALNVTVEEPWDVPKFVPEIRTEDPTVPDVGESPEIAGKMVKLI